jgi:hypothetical protein
MAATQSQGIIRAVATQATAQMVGLEYAETAQAAAVVEGGQNGTPHTVGLAK